jgi:hypothetical protein
MKKAGMTNPESGPESASRGVAWTIMTIMSANTLVKVTQDSSVFVMNGSSLILLSNHNISITTFLLR